MFEYMKARISLDLQFVQEYWWIYAIIFVVFILLGFNAKNLFRKATNKSKE